MTIRFGTDGWRAIVGEGFTDATVMQLMQAFCDFHAQSKNKKIILGYDRRFCSSRFASSAATVLLGNGFTVEMSPHYVPTPLVSCRVVQRRALAGVMITASHNPYMWNGIKLKESDGGSACLSYVQAIEAQFEKNLSDNRKIKKMALEEAIQKRQLRYFNPMATYLKQLARMVDLASIQDSKLKVVVDSMHGAGAGFLKTLLGERVVEIRQQEDPLFGGVNPEPIEKNLEVLKANVKQHHAQIGLATDGDADRIGAVDEKGNFVSSQQIFSLLLKHLLEARPWRGKVIKTVSTTQMVDRICEKFCIPLTETSIGFKHICQAFREEPVLIGGEESGGIGIPQHVPERDGLLCGLLLLEIIAKQKIPFSKIVQNLQKEYGPLYFRREDIVLELDKQKIFLQKLKQKLNREALQNFKAVRLDKKDGWKFYFSDDSWLLIRTSGTEPLLRLYVEAMTPQQLEQRLKKAKHFIKKIL